MPPLVIHCPGGHAVGEEADAARREEAPAAVHRGGVRNTPGRGTGRAKPHGREGAL
ncbi:hypothetical protein [Prosthecobacter sp. SYSU 5D2]|uniref:hypothetical protein n=1 Tax=Prosthecobacter sp. SYSU 5D2 TaxID=3134134 RepID=UPI0031FED505